MLKKLKCWLAKKIVKHIFLSVNEDDILIVKNGKMYRHGLEITNQDANSIISGARGMQQLEAWNIVINDTRFMLNQQIFNTAQSADDLLFARGGLWAIDIMEKKVRNLSKLR
jgi:hypothetical protein